MSHRNAHPDSPAGLYHPVGTFRDAIHCSGQFQAVSMNHIHHATNSRGRAPVAVSEHGTYSSSAGGATGPRGGGSGTHSKSALSRPIPVLVVMAFIALCSSIPGVAVFTTPPLSLISLRWLNPDAQNMAHIPVYAALAAAWLHALDGQRSGILAAFAAFFATLVCGALDEAYQLLIPGRTTSVEDLTRDAAGAVLGIGVAIALRQWCKSRRQSPKNESPDTTERP